MATNWDSYWGKEINRSYWLEPDKAVIDLVNRFDMSQIKGVLDLGCGIGRHTLLLAETGFDVTALDSSTEALALLRKQCEEKGIIVNIIQGDYSQNHFSQESFDFILAYNVLYHGHREDFQNAIHLIHKWLRPQGWFFFTCPSRRDDKYGNGALVAPHTFRSLNSVHAGDIHLADEADILDLLTEFNIISKHVDEHYWYNNGVRQFSSYWKSF
jgi:2-polyprenyl-3-methyl-5-hydroxy-6-metoxy-1,4-benzoquinol methylase